MCMYVCMYMYIYIYIYIYIYSVPEAHVLLQQPQRDLAQLRVVLAPALPLRLRLHYLGADIRHT